MLCGDKQTATQEMCDGGVIQCMALAAIWRRAAGTVREGREQVYMSARLSVTCAKECAAALEPRGQMCTSTQQACLCVGVLTFARDTGM